MELRHLRYFLAVAEAQNFTRASQRLRVAQPALSRQIADLEHELSVRLLERSPRGAALTAAGKAFASEAKVVLERAEDAARVARAFASGERGELQLGYAPSPTVRLLPRILHAYQSEAPGVRVVLHDLSSGEMLQGLHRGNLHVALMVRPAATDLRGLHFEELCRDPIAVAVPNGHPRAHARTIDVASITGEPLVAFSRQDYPEYHEMLAELFAPTGAAPTVVEELDSATSLMAAVEARHGLAIVASSLAFLAGPRLRVIELRPAPAPLVVGVAHNPRTSCPVAERFRKLLRALPKTPSGSRR